MWAWVKLDPSAIAIHRPFPARERHGRKHVSRALVLDDLQRWSQLWLAYMTKPKPDCELAGLVYGATEIPSEGLCL